MKRVEEIGIVPVIAIDDAEKAVPLAHALANGGIPAAEVTFRTAAGEQAIKNIAKACPDILLGAGTVLNIEQADRALNAGARYIVSPGYNSELVRYCVKNEVPVLPGCVNASDLTRAINDGLSVVKFFPAEQAGGISAIKTLAPVFPALRFMPTGGVNLRNLLDYLTFPKVIACGGTWMVKKDLIEGERFCEIEQICRDAVQTMLGFNLVHIGINSDDAAGAENTAGLFDSAFGFRCKDETISVFAGSYVECMKGNGRGAKGHIAIGTYHVGRAEAYLRQKGFHFVEETRKADANGCTKLIYLEEDFNGFAIHLIQR